jgi:hypothetical protein
MGYGGMQLCVREALQPLQDAAQMIVDEADLSCVPRSVSWDIEGGMGTDRARMSEVSGGACDMYSVSNHEFVVSLDEEGYVSQVTPTSTDPDAVETANCVAAALKGLQFPCLANFDVCPEYLIAE